MSIFVKISGIMKMSINPQMSGFCGNDGDPSSGFQCLPMAIYATKMENNRHIGSRVQAASSVEPKVVVCQ